MCGGERTQTLRSWKDGFESRMLTLGSWLIVCLGVFSLSFALAAKRTNQTILKMCIIGIIGEMSGHSSRNV